MINLDDETRSIVDLKKEGLYRYARHASTDVLCVAYSIDGKEPGIWRRGDKVPLDLKREVRKGETIHAWNASFERLLWRILAEKYGWPMPKLTQFRCTAAAARAQGWPRALGDAARFAGVKMQKDYEGQKIMMKMCRPQKDGTWYENPRDFERLYEYCQQDVRTEMAIGEFLRPLNDEELEMWQYTEIMNDRGWQVDVELARRAVATAEKFKRKINAEIADLTGGYVTSVTQNERLLKWVNKQGFKLKTLEEKFLRPKLYDAEGDVREVLELRLHGARAAVAKFETLLKRVDDDGRLRGLYVYHGAGQTGRFTASGVQVHNLKRLPDDFDRRMADNFLKKGAVVLGKKTPLRNLAMLVRMSFIAPKKKYLAVGDWSAIEAMILPWIAEGIGIDTDGYIDEWRAPKLTVYEKQAGLIFNLPWQKVSDEQRRSGKICVLAFGYQGGANAYLTMARNYGEVVDEETAAERCQAWRKANPWAKKLWNAMNDAAVKAARNRHMIVNLGLIQFMADDLHLYMKLPSGRVITYPFIEMRLDSYDRWQVSYRRGNRKPPAGETEWPRVTLYGGLLTENADQGIARDILRDCLLRLRKHKKLTPVGHTHDEGVCECDKGGAALLKKEMEVLPKWAKGLPLRVGDSWEDKRYG